MVQVPMWTVFLNVFLLGMIAGVGLVFVFGTRMRGN